MGRAAKLKIRRKKEQSQILIERMTEGLYLVKHRDVEMIVGCKCVNEAFTMLQLYLKGRAEGNPLVDEPVLYAIQRNSAREQLN